MKVIEAPGHFTVDNEGPLVFLAGSIEGGRARNWQTDAVEALEEVPGVLLNPRRATWSPLDKDELRRQINWELDGLEAADIVFFYFDPDTRSPVSLLELGLMARQSNRKVVVCCPDGYWRQENVEETCKRYNRTLIRTFEEGMSALGKAIREVDNFHWRR